MENQVIDTAIAAYQAGNEQAFSDLYRDWLSLYLKALVANASSERIGLNSQELESLAHAVAAHACRTWKPSGKACFKTWLCMIWRQRLCSAIQANRSGNAVGRRLTLSLDQMIEGDDGEFNSTVADPQAANPVDVLVALEALSERRPPVQEVHVPRTAFRSPSSSCIMNLVRVTRQHLYERVWSTPMWKLCEEFGLSDRGLAKLCARHNIPRPPRGYWAKTQAGQFTKRTALPSPHDNHTIEVRPSEPPIETAAIRKAKEAKMSEIENSKPPVTVSETLRGAHPLVSETRNLLESTERDENGFLKRVKGCLRVQVSKKSLHRALLLVDALIKALEEHGFPVRVTESSTQAQVLGVSVEFGIFETLVDLKEEIDEPQDLSGGYRFHHSAYQFKKVPSGQLCIRIDPDETYYWRYGSGVRRKWSDGEKRKLEDHLDVVLEGFLKVAAIKRDAEIKAAEERQRREEARKQWEEQERRRAEMWEKVQAEQRRVDGLLSDAKNWRRSNLLRKYIEAVRTSAQTKESSTEEQSKTNAWILWASEQADRLDPLRPSPPSILDDEDKYRPPQESRR